LKICSNELRCLSQPPRKRPTPWQYFRKERLDPYVKMKSELPHASYKLCRARLDESKLTKSTRTRTTLERVPRGVLAASARHPLAATRRLVYIYWCLSRRNRSLRVETFCLFAPVLVPDPLKTLTKHPTFERSDTGCQTCAV
jgi:hypothetical protein